MSNSALAAGKAQIVSRPNQIKEGIAGEQFDSLIQAVAQET